MEVARIISGMTQKNQELSIKVDELESLGEQRAQAERNYKVAYATKLMLLRTDGIQMALINDVAKGDRNVSKLKFEWDLKDAMFRACLERIKSIDKAIETYRSILSWEKMEFEKSGLS